MDEFIGQDQMAGAGNGQPFGDALDDAQQRREKIIQQISPPYSGRTASVAGARPAVQYMRTSTSKTSPTGSGRTRTSL